jgi:hypothetical protein
LLDILGNALGKPPPLDGRSRLVLDEEEEENIDVAPALLIFDE